MKIVKASWEFEGITDDLQALGIDTICDIANIGRVCYKSEPKPGEDEFEQDVKLVKALIKSGHHSVLEHRVVSVRIICDRGVTHELVRHRLSSFSQESTRYVNYSHGKFGSECTFIKPSFLKDCPEGSVTEDRLALYLAVPNNISLWLSAMRNAEHTYLEMINIGMSPQEARSVLPNSLKTEIVMTMNFREWRHFFNLRAIGTTGKPHPQMLEITVPMLAKFKEVFPVIFDDLVVVS